MKILVLSDSHAALSFMRLCIDTVHPDRIIHLGDYYDDAEAMTEEYPDIPMTRVPGNCDEYRCPPGYPEILVRKLDQVRFYLTHGHRHGVKQDISRLLRDARENHAQAVLYGHTHVPNCYQEPDGLWVLNPGSCGYFGGSAGLIITDHGKIVSCRNICQKDLEEMR